MSLPLDGLRILDLSSFMPGPFATQLLAELGATVLKVERPPQGDAMREILPPMYEMLNRGKHSVALDLRDEGDRALLLDLVEGARVVVDGFRPGVLERLGVGFDVLRERRPDLIYVSLSGWGWDGPLRDATGHNSNYLARTGFVALTGELGEPPSDATAVPVADLAASMYAVVGILASLQTTESLHIDVPLLAAGLAWTAPRLAEYAAKGATHRDQLLGRPANGVFRTSDGYITIAAVEDHFFRALCEAIGREDLLERPELARYADRFAHAAELHEIIQGAVASGTRAEWDERLRAAGVPVGPVLAPEEVGDDPGVAHLGIYHREPVIHTTPPILGLPFRHLTRSPAVDVDGLALRRGGWDALATT